MKKILIGHLGSYGDLLQATPIARQIKHDNPDCKVYWGVGSTYMDILFENPYIDFIWDYKISGRSDVVNKWDDFVKHANELMELGCFDEVYFTQVYPGQPELFHGSARESIFRTYPNKITVPREPVLVLKQEEWKKAISFISKHNLCRYRRVILFECSPQSGQSSITSKGAMKIANGITIAIPDAIIILSGSPSMLSGIDYNERIINGGGLTLRETAELTRFCTMLLGTGSGITQLCQSSWAKHLPTIQLLNEGTVASLNHENACMGKYATDIIEITDCSPEHVIKCVTSAIVEGFPSAHRRFNEHIIPDFAIIRFRMQVTNAVSRGKYLDIIPAFVETILWYDTWSERAKFVSTFLSDISKFISYGFKGA